MECGSEAQRSYRFSNRKRSLRPEAEPTLRLPKASALADAVQMALSQHLSPNFAVAVKKKARKSP